MSTSGETIDVDPLITDTADRFLGELCTHEAIQAAEETGDAAEIWAAFAATGFPWISLPTEHGGSGGSLADALEVLRLVGYHAAPVAAAETGILGGWLLAGAGFALPGAVVTVAASADVDAELTATGLKLSGSLYRVPWANVAERLALLVDVDGRSMVASVPIRECGVTPMTNLAGERRDTVLLDRIEVDAAPAAEGVDADALRFRGALSRAALMAGAIEKISQLTVSYTSERVQFGRPVARFQAVQQHLVWAAQDAAMVRLAAESAGRAASRGPAEFEIASAKLIANQGAARATRACHQAHGAMGMTQEYPLHHYTRRLWSWRKEYGGERTWRRWLGRLAAGQGADGLYPLITGGTSGRHVGERGLTLMPEPVAQPPSESVGPVAYGDVAVTVGSDHVAVAEIRRPPHNFFDIGLIDSLARAFADLDADARCRAIVLCSQGKNFCAGARFGDDESRRRAAEVLGSDGTPRHLYDAAVELFSNRTPVIAAVQGAAIGGGLGVACFADFRFVAPEARFSANFARLGFHHGFGLTVTLPALVGQQKALELLYTGARIKGEEAAAIGLADRLVPLDDLRAEAHAFAREIALSAPLAVASIRETMRGHLPAAIRARDRPRTRRTGPPALD